MRNPAIAALLLALTAAPLAAQERQEMGNEPPEPPELTDANIAAIVVVANQADIDNGELALEKATDERVRAFANQMIESHTAINEAAGELVTELGVTPEASEVSRSIHDAQEAARERLDDLSGREFDRAYIDNEVTYHEAVIEAVDEVLIPSAQNEQLEQTLIDARPAFVSHLEQARSIQEELVGEYKQQ
ncbi:MAG: DUF4142 domain-containing protein [Gemmatimonadota bacterium]